MTTQVKITITQAHNPIKISGVGSLGKNKTPLITLKNKDDTALFYVHSGASLHVEEVNAEEKGTDGSGD